MIPSPGNSIPGACVPMTQFERPLEADYKLMWLLALLPTLTYCQSSQVTEMLIAVKEQFVSMKLQLKYYWAAILDWQCSECMLNSQHLPLAEPEIWLAAKWNTFTHVGYLVKRHLQPSVPSWTCWEQWQVRADFWKVNLQLTSSDYYLQLHEKWEVLYADGYVHVS